jgi:polysaccharide deacetylase 2 family uncharacterized protein YibQ
MPAKKKVNTFNLRVIAVVLIVVLIFLFALYRYFVTPAGRIFLLDMGLDDRYEQVQRDLEEGIYQALVDSGINRADIEFELAGGGGRKIMFIEALVSDDVPLVKVNASIDREVESLGGKVRSCREKVDGRGITMKIGTDRVETHTVIIRRSEKAGRTKGGEGSLPRMALIVDDFGFFYNSLVRDFLKLDVDITISVIPGLRHSERICESALDGGKEVICHLPMEPQRGADDVGDIPLIRVEMDSGEIKKAVLDALETTPGVVGMNNHMGSLATADCDVMRAVLEVCVERGLFFLDSKTSNKSVVEEIGKEVGADVISNDIFLDNRDEDTHDSMLKLLSIAARRGEAVGILHVRRDSFEALEWLISEAKRNGVRLVKITELVRREEVAIIEGGKN